MQGTLFCVETKNDTFWEQFPMTNGFQGNIYLAPKTKPGISELISKGLKT